MGRGDQENRNFSKFLFERSYIHHFEAIKLWLRHIHDSRYFQTSYSPPLLLDIIFTNILSMTNSGYVSYTSYLFLLHTLQNTIFPAPPPCPFFSFSLLGLMGRCSVIEVEPQNSRTPLAFPSTFCKTLYLKY